MENTKIHKNIFNWDEEETHCDLEDEYIKERKDSDSIRSLHSCASDNNVKMARSPLKKKGTIKISHRDAFIEEFEQEKTKRQGHQNRKSSFYHRKPEESLILNQLKQINAKENFEADNMVKSESLLREASINESESEDYPEDSEYYFNTINDCLVPSTESPQLCKQQKQVMVTMADVMPSKRPSN
ncbi:unnamed protein product [Moneuplotes crassus]|uniref:Uncharacterized protein n=1 Tax=Euplotes crassus TaxID=5936 RepID=A0AAD2DBM0_EUPCR|nr:unnamed protein product [Moneuplotes crassus]